MAMSPDCTLLILKPDVLQRGLVGEILSRLEAQGMRIAGMRMIWIDAAMAEQLYAVHRSSTRYISVLSYITSGPSIAIMVNGEEVVTRLRALIGASPTGMPPLGTIRGDYANSKCYNLVHASDSADAAAQELALFF